MYSQEIKQNSPYYSSRIWFIHTIIWLTYLLLFIHTFIHVGYFIGLLSGDANFRHKIPTFQNKNSVIKLKRFSDKMSIQLLLWRRLAREEVWMLLPLRKIITIDSHECLWPSVSFSYCLLLFIRGQRWRHDQLSLQTEGTLPRPHWLLLVTTFFIIFKHIMRLNHIKLGTALFMRFMFHTVHEIHVPYTDRLNRQNNRQTDVCGISR